MDGARERICCADPSSVRVWFSPSVRVMAAGAAEVAVEDAAAGAAEGAADVAAAVGTIEGAAAGAAVVGAMVGAGTDVGTAVGAAGAQPARIKLVRTTNTSKDLIELYRDEIILRCSLSIAMGSGKYNEKALSLGQG